MLSAGVALRAGEMRNMLAMKQHAASAKGEIIAEPERAINSEREL